MVAAPQGPVKKMEQISGLSEGVLSRAKQDLRAQFLGWELGQGKQSALQEEDLGRLSFWWAGPNH